MPSLTNITATFFTGLITRLGLRPPPPEGYLLSNVVTPVSIVDSDIQLNAAVTPVLFSTPSGGEFTASAINTVFSDTGALVAGTYLFTVWLTWIATAANRSIGIQHRDSANAANIWAQNIYPSPTGLGIQTFQWRESIATNERVRVIANVNFGAGESVYSNLWNVAV